MRELLPDVAVLGPDLCAPREGVVCRKMHFSGWVVKVPFWDRLAPAADRGWMTGYAEVSARTSGLPVIRLQSFWLDSFHGFLSPEGWTISKSWKMSARYGLLQISPKPWRLTQILFASTELPELLQNHHLWMC